MADKSCCCMFCKLRSSLLPTLCWNEVGNAGCACADCKCKNKRFFGLKWKSLSIGVGRLVFCDKKDACCDDKKDACCDDKKDGA